MAEPHSLMERVRGGRSDLRHSGLSGGRSACAVPAAPAARAGPDLGASAVATSPTGARDARRAGGCADGAAAMRHARQRRGVRQPTAGSSRQRQFARQCDHSGGSFGEICCWLLWSNSADASSGSRGDGLRISRNRRSEKRSRSAPEKGRRTFRMDPGRMLWRRCSSWRSASATPSPQDIR